MFCVVSPTFSVNQPLVSEMPRGANLSRDRNLKGRPKGSKNKFTSFKIAAQNSFAYQGEEAYLNRVAAEDPAAYLTFIGRFVPKQLEIDINVTDFRTRLLAAEERLIDSQAVKRLPDRSDSGTEE